MTYTQFLAAVKRAGWSAAELRCDIPPSAALLKFMDHVGLELYEEFTMRFIGHD